MLKELGPIILSRLAWVAIGLALGAILVPPRKEVEVREVEKQVVVIQEKVVKVREATKQAVVKTEERKPDGTVTKRTESQKEALVDAVLREDSKTTTLARTMTVHRPDWRVGALLGATPKLDVVGGAVVERRIVGPLSAGVWVLGSSPTTAFKPSFQAAGVSLSAEF